MNDATKICSKCTVEKELKEYAYRDKNKGILRGICKTCTKEQHKIYYQENKEEIKEHVKKYQKAHKEEIKEQHKVYYEEHKEERKIYIESHREEIKEQQKIYREEHKEEIKKQHKEYRKKHKEKIKTKHNSYRKRCYRNNISYKLRRIVSASINKGLKANNSSKKGQSIVQFLSYTFEELKYHLESQFEFWMTWENYGKYNEKTWIDNDQSTWTWNIDHIIPQSDLPYISMADQNFKLCWTLNNLRPLSAKQNLFDGLNKIRHNKTIIASITLETKEYQ